MSSRLKLQKNTAAKKKAEQQVQQVFLLTLSVTWEHPCSHSNKPFSMQALQEESRQHEQALFDSLQGTAPGTAGKLTIKTVLPGCIEYPMNACADLLH